MIQTDTKGQILKMLEQSGKVSVTDIVKNLPKRRSRQWISTLLTEMHGRGN